MYNYTKVQLHRASPDTAFVNSPEMYVYKSMCLEHLALMPGILAKHGWSNFKIDEKGALDLRRKILPTDLSDQVEKAFSDVSMLYVKAVQADQAMAAVRCLVAQPWSPPALRILTMSLSLYRKGIGRITSIKSLDTCM